jgi:hypothetical protein
MELLIIFMAELGALALGIWIGFQKREDQKVELFEEIHCLVGEIDQLKNRIRIQRNIIEKMMQQVVDAEDKNLTERNKRMPNDIEWTYSKSEYEAELDQVRKEWQQYMNNEETHGR